MKIRMQEETMMISLVILQTERNNCKSYIVLKTLSPTLKWKSIWRKSTKLLIITTVTLVYAESTYLPVSLELKPF